MGDWCRRPEKWWGEAPVRPNALAEAERSHAVRDLCLCAAEPLVQRVPPLK